MSISESLQNCKSIAEHGNANGISVEAVVAVAFGCPLEGHVTETRVIEIVGALAKMDYREISIADSVGLGNPAQVRILMRALQRSFPDVHFSLHLHNTRGLGLANALSAIEEGIDTFDSSIGGLGGCPIVRGGKGNIPTEDLINMAEEMGLATGIDIHVIMTACRMAQEFLGRPFPSYILSSGTRQQLYRSI
jgi:hydroxymethylglutaryl-CoA lyase